jgi:hypothetical protein
MMGIITMIGNENIMIAHTRNIKFSKIDSIDSMEFSTKKLRAM